MLWRRYWAHWDYRWAVWSLYYQSWGISELSNTAWAIREHGLKYAKLHYKVPLPAPRLPHAACFVPTRLRLRCSRS